VLLIRAHKELEGHVCTGAERKFKVLVDQQWAEIAYCGLWGDPLFDDLVAFSKQVQKRVTGKVDITIDTTSVNSGTPQFDKHLQSADLFDAAKHPTIKFVSDKFSFNGDKVSEVTGQLTLLGKTAPVTLKATQFNCYDSPMLKREVCGGDFETTIDRTQWGMNYGVDWGFSKNVRLVVQIEAVKQ